MFSAYISLKRPELPDSLYVAVSFNIRQEEIEIVSAEVADEMEGFFHEGDSVEITDDDVADNSDTLFEAARRQGEEDRGDRIRARHSDD